MESLVPADRHLLSRRSALRARRFAARCSTTRKPRTASFSKRASPRPAPCASFIAAGTALRHPRPQHHPVLHLLLHVRLSAHRRPGLGGRRHARSRGFLLGGTAGRTTLNGEGLQHQDGNSHLLAYTVPNLKTYDPAYAYELAVIVRDGIRRMYVDQEDIFYYITVENEPYLMPASRQQRRGHPSRDVPLPRDSGSRAPANRAQLFGSGAILNEALKAQEILAERFNVAADVWSITSFKELYMDGTDCDRWNRLHRETRSQDAVDQAVPRRHRRRLRRRLRLCQSAPRVHRQVVPESAGLPGYRRFRTIRKPRRPPPLLRGRRGGHRHRDPRCPGR